MNFRIRRASDINCEKCNRLVARELRGKVQVKAGKVVMETERPVSVSCWSCGYVNLFEIEAELTVPMMALADTA